MALEGANKMTNLINNVLKYSRMGGSGFNLELKSIEYSVRNVTSALSAKIRDTNALIYMSNLPEIKCDSHQIEQMLQNIIDNSIKYSKPNERPVILIQAYERQDDWLFCVADNGIGMDLEDGIEELFQPFKRLENTKNIDGSGIGLAICKKAVTNHGGKIWIESELGKGSTFYFTISKYLNLVPNNVA
jgi:light-regulated signal transduction histidine kinase (bacteriophytochrome)